MKQYKLIKAHYAEDLETKVNDEARIGYEPFGSLQVLPIGSNADNNITRLYLQPMVREVNDK